MNLRNMLLCAPLLQLLSVNKYIIKNILNHAEQTYRIFLGQVFRLELFLLYKDSIYTQCTVSMCLLCNLAFRMLLVVLYINNVEYKVCSYITDQYDYCILKVVLVSLTPHKFVCLPCSYCHKFYKIKKHRLWHMFI
jgi:hypothetical protein